MTRWIVLLASLAPGFAFAQAGVKPEVLLMIDGSTDMGRPIGGAQAVCEPTGAAAPRDGVVYTPGSRLNLIKEALVGTVRAPGRARWCTADSPLDRDGHALGRDGAYPNIRQMCCAVGDEDSCQSWAPCYNDHGRSLASVDAVQHDSEAARKLDGAIDLNASEIKFGLMFSDGATPESDGANGHYSYGNEVKFLFNGTRVNIGARRTGSHIGALIRPNRVENIGGGAVDQNVVGEEDAAVRAHNEVVREFAGRLVAHGPPALAAMLHDAVFMYRNNPPEACRNSTAIMITWGREVDRRGYDRAIEYAEQLGDLGVTLHVIVVTQPGGDAFGELWGRTVVEAAGDGKMVTATSAEQIRKAVVQLSRAAITGRRSRTKPLIVSAAPADYCADGAFPCAAPDDATRQWRLNAFAWMVNGVAYGRMQAVELTCAERDPDRPSVPQPRADLLKYEEVLRQRGDRDRRTVSYRPDTDEPFVVTGGASPVFGADGTNTFGDNARLAEFLNVQQAEVDNPDANAADLQPAADEEDHNDDNGVVVQDIPENPNRIRGAGLLVNGFFGGRGLGDDARRQLGATLTGDIVALRPPGLGLTDPAYQAYRAAEDERKTLVAAGGQDGLVHFFRALDGVEVFNLLPGAGWGQLVNGEAPMDGPLSVADIVPCRALGAGDEQCPEELNFEAWLVGSTGRSASNLFGIRLSAARAWMDDPDRAIDLAADVGDDGLWDKGPDDLRSDVLPELTLAGASSRPVLTHVRDGDVIRAAVILGCGAGQPDPVPSSPGRCVLVLDAISGDVIRRFDIGSDANLGGTMLYSMTGSPVAYPSGGIAPASRAYIGDEGGQLWRMDLRDTNPANWTIGVAWPPPEAAEAGGYQRGRGVVDRPSLAVREDGGLVVTFVTDRTGAVDDPNLGAYAVSFTDRAIIGDDAVTYEVSRNWLLPFNDDEYATGAPIIRDGVVYITTREGVPDGTCTSVRGRLYGVDFYRRFVDGDGAPSSYTGADGQTIEALPALAQFDQDGPTGQRALSIILPPGMVAYGMAIARTPSCADEVAGTTDLILNVGDESLGRRAQGAAAVEQARVEVVQGGAVQEKALDGGVFMQNRGVQLEVCLDCTADGEPAQGANDAALPPFPSQVVYWGSTFLN